ncbi:MAG: nitroreductase family protein [Candidatus Methanomethylophilaceae archaeon]|nr:nitroreductase family protein [Candidatus Methanomethylophilaceae archaeon]
MSEHSELLKLMEERYSVRSYSGRPVEDGKLELILRAGLCAPTAVNRRPQRVFVLRSRKALEKASEVTRFTFGAPVILLVCSDTDAGRTTDDGQYLGTVDASIATTQMMLEAWELGIGSCWVRGFDRKKVSEAFDLPDNLLPEAMLPMGYPSEDSEPSQMHFIGIPMSRMATYL